MSAERPVSLGESSAGPSAAEHVEPQRGTNAELRIKDLRESPRRPGRYLLQLSDGRTLVLGVGVLADCGATRVGQVLSEAVVQRLTHESAVTAVADRALDMLARGRRTRRELERRLLRPPMRRGKPAPLPEDSAARASQVAEALNRLEASGLLSDAEVAEAEAAARLRRGEAPNRVSQMLRRKGVAGKVVQDAVQAAVQEAMADERFDERAACRAMAEKRARALGSLAPEVAKRRLLGFLLRRGYSAAVARDVTRDVLVARGVTAEEWEDGNESILADETLD